MALFKWSDDFSVGISSIDNQHQKIIELINQLNHALAEGKGRDSVGKILDELITYTQTHFEEEEAMMEDADYPGLVEHREKHRALTEKVLSLKRDFNKNHMNVSFEVSQFLHEWLKKHILGTDRLYTPFMQIQK